MAFHTHPLVTLFFGTSPRLSLISMVQGALHLEQLRQPRPLLVPETPLPGIIIEHIHYYKYWEEGKDLKYVTIYQP